jgi:hypothetical protein
MTMTIFIIEGSGISIISIAEKTKETEKKRKKSRACTGVMRNRETEKNKEVIMIVIGVVFD